MVRPLTLQLCIVKSSSGDGGECPCPSDLKFPPSPVPVVIWQQAQPCVCPWAPPQLSNPSPCTACTHGSHLPPWLGTPTRSDFQWWFPSYGMQRNGELPRREISFLWPAFGMENLQCQKEGCKRLQETGCGMCHFIAFSGNCTLSHCLPHPWMKGMGPGEYWRAPVRGGLQQLCLPPHIDSGHRAVLHFYPVGFTLLNNK